MKYEDPPDSIKRELESKLANSSKYSVLTEESGWYRLISYSKSNGLWQATVSFSKEATARTAIFEYRAESPPKRGHYWYMVRDRDD